MTGKLRYCWLFGFIGFLITLAISTGNNLFMTSLVRGLIAFVVWFGLSYAALWMFDALREQPNQSMDEELTATFSEQGKGGNYDLTTPDESEELNDLLKQPPVNSVNINDFSPLNPPKLVKTTNDKDAEELVKVVRHLTEE
jgi:hypothetical protein